MPAIDQVFDLFQALKLISAVETRSPVLVCRAKTVTSLPCAQTLHSDACQGGDTANAVKIVRYLLGHLFVQVQRMNKDTVFSEVV